MRPTPIPRYLEPRVGGGLGRHRRRRTVHARGALLLGLEARHACKGIAELLPRLRNEVAVCGTWVACCGSGGGQGKQQACIGWQCGLAALPAPCAEALAGKAVTAAAHHHTVAILVHLCERAPRR